jgi:hypothetical protein
MKRTDQIAWLLFLALLTVATIALLLATSVAILE